MYRTTLVQYFQLVTLFVLTLTLTLTWYKTILIQYLLHPLGGILAMFWFAAVISPVWVGDKTKLMILTFDLTCDP